MKDLIGTIARAIVDAPEQVTVSEVEGGHTLVLELKVEKQDKGKLSASRVGQLKPSELY